MRLFATVFGAGLVISLSGPAQERRLELREYKSEAGRFTVLLPETPSHKTIDLMGLSMHQYQATFGQTIFSLSHVEMPDEVTKVPPKVLFDGAQAGEIEEANGRLLSSKDIKLEDYPGREFVMGFKSADGLTGRIRTVRMYLVGRTFYQVGINQGDQAASKEVVDRYLKSFKVQQKK